LGRRPLALGVGASGRERRRGGGHQEGRTMSGFYAIMGTVFGVIQRNEFVNGGNI
jgi:hypothetical protein